MKKLKKLKKPSIPKGLKRPFKRAKPTEERMADAFAIVPRITNETVAEHREEVLAGARKYIYPLQHSKHRVVRTSIILLVTVLVAFFAYCGLALYKLQSTGTFIYGVTQVIPFPVAKAGPSWISYQSYLFELRRNMHYYQTQQQIDFSTKDGKSELASLKKQAMTQVVQNAYVKQLAAKNHVSVSDQAVNNEVAVVRSQNRLGSSDRVFKEVLNDFWGWDESAFKTELKQQLLQQAVVAKLDTLTATRAKNAAAAIQGGTPFATVATQNSDDTTTKAAGGVYPSAITKTAADIAPLITAEIFKLQPNQVSPIINAGYTLEIVEVIDVSATSRHAAHIQFTLKPISTYVNPLEAKHAPKHFIKV